MTPTSDPRPTFWTPTNVMGFFLAACGVALGAWSKATNTLTTPTLIAVGLLVGAGMWFVNSPLAAGFAHEASTIVPGILRRGQLNVAQPEDTSVVVERPAAPDVVVPPQADPVVMRDRAAPVDRLAYNTTDRIALAPRVDPPRETPTLRMTIPDAPAPVRRRRRATDPAPVLVPPTEVQPQSESPLDGVNREDG